MKKLLPILLIFLFSCKKEVREISYSTGALNKYTDAPLIVSGDYFKALKTFPPTRKRKDPKDSSQIPVDTTIIQTLTAPAQYFIKAPPITSQGAEGACVAFALAYARWVKNYQEKKDTVTFSSEFIYNTLVDRYKKQYGYWGCDQGSFVTDAFNLIASTGVCLSRSFATIDNNCSNLPGESQVSEAGNYKSTYSQIYTSDRAAIKDLIYHNRAVIISIAIDAQFFSAGPAFMWKEYLGPVIGGHAIMISGYDDFRNAYRVENSWGTGWGDEGYGWIDYNFLPKAAFEYSYVFN